MTGLPFQKTEYKVNLIAWGCKTMVLQHCKENIEPHYGKLETEDTTVAACCYGCLLTRICQCGDIFLLADSNIIYHNHYTILCINTARTMSRKCPAKIEKFNSMHIKEVEKPWEKYSVNIIQMGWPQAIINSPKSNECQMLTV